MVRMGVSVFIFSVILYLLLVSLSGYGDLVEDRQTLLDFVKDFRHSREIDWNQSLPVCSSWGGVTCNSDHTRVVALRLPAMGFNGSVPVDSLSRLSALQILSLRGNLISGPFPSDLLKLENLTGLYLESNRFSGPLPENLSVFKKISVLNLSSNHFSGSIPVSISNLSHLVALDLSNNQISGEIPDFNLTSLQLLNLSNNNLTGTLPLSLQKFPSSAFLGNSFSSKASVSTAPPEDSPPRQPPHRSSKKLSESAILGIVIGGCLFMFVLLTVYIMLCCSNKEGVGASRVKSQGKENNSKKRVTESHEHNGRITFFEGSNLAFDLEDLLRASAEVLGKGTFGTTYKAALEDSTTVVVKRLKDVSVGKREFEQQMEAVGRIRHEHVAPLRAYYYSKDEKLMVYDHFLLGSISTLLHGKQGENRIVLDWDTRLRIAIGGARGLAHVHTQNGGKWVHGNIKSSNIFLNPHQYGCISDLGLATIVTPLGPSSSRSAGYRAPELTDPRRATQASDVYSFGVVLLELLTGKSPLGEGMNLVKWVNSVVREEWTGEVFDVELLRYPNVEEEMVQMLQLGLLCASSGPDQRPRMADVVRMAEEIQRSRSENSTPTSISYGVEIGSTSVPTPQ